MSVLLRPSNKAWPICSAQPWLEAQNQHRIPKDTRSKDSDEGSVAHDRAERVLRGEEERPGKDDLLAIYTDWVLDKAKLNCVAQEDILVEAKMPTCVDPDYEGTVDAATIIFTDDHVILDIDDLKWGVGQKVHAEGNTQTLNYARSLYEAKIKGLVETGVIDEVRTVRMSIIQPRYYGEESPTSTWELSFEDFIRESDLLMVKADLIREKKDLKFVAGDHCTFCPCQGFCLKRHEHALEHFPSLDEPFDSLSEERIAELYSNRKPVDKLLKQVTKHVEKTARAGLSEFFGVATGTRFGNTSWTNPKTVVRTIRKVVGGRLGSKDLHEQVLLTPTKVKALMTKEEIELAEEKALWFRPEPGKVVVPIAEADTVEVEDVFEKETLNTETPNIDPFS